MEMGELIPLLGQVAGIPVPTRKLPLSLLYALAAIQEVYARITGKPVLLGLATVRLMVREAAHPFQSGQERARTGPAFSSAGADAGRYRGLVSPAWLVLNG